MKCAHCRLDFDERQMFERGGEHFCCTGCAAVFELLHDKGLGEFYNKLGKNTLEPVNFRGEFGVNLGFKNGENNSKNYENSVNFGLNSSSKNSENSLNLNSKNAENFGLNSSFENNENFVNLGLNLNSQNYENSANLNSNLNPNSSSKNSQNNANFDNSTSQNIDLNSQNISSNSHLNFNSNLNNAYQNFVRKNEDGFSEIHLIISGIHCAACVWLNEKVLSLENGVIEASVNPLTHKARVVFDESALDLAQILALIEAIGYKASIYDPLKAEQKAVATRREFYAKLVVAIACVMNVMWIAVAKYAGFFSTMEAGIKDILNFAEFILASPVLFFTGSAFYKSAYFSLKNRQISMDFLVIFGATLAYAYSVWAMFSRSGEVYFDSVAMIICFVFVGKYLEVLTRKYAADSMDSLNELLKGEILVFNGTKFAPKEPYAVQKGDIIALKTGDKVLIDGLCVRGEASLDTSSLTGENAPLLVNAGKMVSSGCVVLDGYLEYEASEIYANSKLSKIISLLESSQSKKPKIQALVEKISVYFSRTVLFLAFLCFCFWCFYRQSGAELALINAISLLIIACPCALALATPVANLTALFYALKKGVLFKSADKIELLGKCDYAVFDKTGVLTNFNLKISRHFLNKNLNLAEFSEFIKLSNHPVSASINEFISQNFSENLSVNLGSKKGRNSAKILKNEFNFSEVKEIRAKGISAKLNGINLLGGNVNFMKENGVNLSLNLSENLSQNSSKNSSKNLAKKSKNSSEILIKNESVNLNENALKFSDTHFIFARNNEILAFFEFESELRAGAVGLVSYLKKLKIPVKMLTGDNEKAAAKVAKKLEITDFEAACSPEYKMHEVASLGEKFKVLMVGDGVNDALALSNAAVAVSLRQGAALASENSDIVLLKNDLNALKMSLRLAKKTLIIIKQNLAFSLCYNALTIPLAFFGVINPLLAAASMSFSSIIVVLNAQRIAHE